MSFTQASYHPCSVRAASGENTKASVHHAFVHDKRDHAVMPSTGHYVGVFSELAGVGQKGDSSFTKHEVAGQFHHTLFQGQAEQSKVVFSVGAKAGLLATLDNDKPAHLSDKYFLGGPLSVRGFKMGGIGPRDGSKLEIGKSSTNMYACQEFGLTCVYDQMMLSAVKHSGLLVRALSAQSLAPPTFLSRRTLSSTRAVLSIGLKVRY